MTWDDHMYCEKCSHHARDCWCYDAYNRRGEYERDYPGAEDRCPGGPGHGYFGTAE